MGWYFRKSFNAGLLRINLSKSGIGYSLGVKGFRIGSGPRGRYLRMGFGCIYYYQKLKDSNKTDKNIENNTVLNLVDERKMKNPSNLENLSENIELEVLNNSSDTGLAHLLNQQMNFCLQLEQKFNEQKDKIDVRRNEIIKDKQKQLESEGFFGKRFMLFCLISLLCPFVIIAYFFLNKKWYNQKEEQIDKKNKPLFTQLDQLEKQLMDKYLSIKTSHKLTLAFTAEQMNFMERIRHLLSNSPTTGDIAKLYPVPVNDSLVKHQYGISEEIAFGDMVLSYLLLELSIPTISIENRTLLFFPQVLIVEENQKFFEIPYRNFKITPYCERVVLKEQPNADDVVEQEVWKHARVDGTQDRRFKENNCYYLVRYYGIKFQNSSFLTKPIYFSNPDATRAFVEELTTILQNIPPYQKLK